MKNLIVKINTINQKKDFVNFVELLLEDLRNNPNDWENKTLESYLEAIGSWTEDMERFYINNQLPIPENVNWSVIANILLAAKMYE